MRWIEGIQPNLKNKKWVFLSLLGIVLLSISIASLMVIIKFALPLTITVPIGLFGLAITLYGITKGFTVANPLGINHDQNERKIRNRGPKVVVIGGGTGLSVLLRGLKLFTSNITAIVTVADDGGGSGKLREDLGMLPPGDIRNCILALAEMEPTMEKLLQYRFEEGTLKGQSFGNLLIAAMDGISDKFEDAIKSISEVLAVTGNVLPVTLENVTLYAKLENGRIIKGESNIPIKSLEDKSPIEKVFIKPKESEAVKDAIKAIHQADIVILGPGSLYTSIIPNLLIQNIKNSLLKTEALKVYIPNVMTQPGETDDYSVTRHVEAILGHCKQLEIDYVIANKGSIPANISQKYKQEGASLIRISDVDYRILKDMDIEVIADNLIEIKKDYVRHDAIKLSKIIVNLVLRRKLSKGKKGFIQYVYMKRVLKGEIK
ncbi:uridine diphosphate-N-acetylglucosamine-binding protein YvcK [Alkaliphilus pronyensis]|uniref:Putative gluconeogenesis factor n=1 Tax=Alkaliphilus pronyensis TaxID=1482732 RepID=A0A6I0FG71_9FIRM|nr:YvcK family protein [Alkaliphilus pronyensis]KAB3537869.1 uridine diphosphate-N-acetylglucosamine-binding protein YvcK [Alkaliphilus pronyensis]